MAARRRGTALLIIDMLNTLDFPEAGQLLPSAKKAAARIQQLKARAKRAKVPVLYVNDNFGHWRSDQHHVYQICSAEGARGRDLALLLPPQPEDYFVLKPKHSGFFSTSLEILLRDLRAKRLVLTGIAGNLCVLFTAHDAHMRDYEVVVPEDCMASNTAADHRYAVRQLRDVLGIKTPPSASVRF